MAEATGLILLLLNVASAKEVPFAIPLYIYNAFFMDLTSVLLCVPLTVKG